MKCKFCGAETKVTDKRESPDGTRRRRECLKCKKRFTTYEKPEDKEIIVVKKDGRREHFVEDKVRLGMIKACEKRPVSMDKIDQIVEEIKDKLSKAQNSRNFGSRKSKDFRGKGKEVKTSLIGELIMQKLKKLDKIAYIRFASVYKEFKDVDDFRNAVLGISDNTPKSKNFGCFKKEVKGL